MEEQQSPTDGWTPVDGVGEPDEAMHLSDLATMNEVTHPVRGLILRRLRQPHTVAEVAAAMGVPVTRLYHHVHRLAEAGLIRVVATRQVAAVTERRFQVVARSFDLDPELAQRLDRTELAQAMGAVFDLAKLGLQRMVESLGPDAITEAREHSWLSLSELSLTPEQQRELVGRLIEVFEDYRSDEDTAETERFTVFLAAYPEATADGAG